MSVPVRIGVDTAEHAFRAGEVAGTPSRLYADNVAGDPAIVERAGEALPAPQHIVDRLSDARRVR